MILLQIIYFKIFAMLFSHNRDFSETEHSYSSLKTFIRIQIWKSFEMFAVFSLTKKELLTMLISDRVLYIHTLEMAIKSRAN